MSENSNLSSSIQMERPRTPPPRSLTNLQIHGVPDRSSSTPAGDPMSSMNQDLLNSYVKNALRPRSIRDPAAYAFILNQLQGNGSPNVISGWLRALSLNSSELTIENSRELLSAIFKLDFTVDKEVQKSFMSLMIELCTSHSTYINQMLKSLIYHITPKKISSKSNGGNLMSSSLLSLDDSNPNAPDRDGSDGGFSTCLYDEEKCEYVRAGIMRTIKEMAKLVPMSSMSILQIFTSLYPYKVLDSFVQRSWLLSALDICRDVPSIREQVLSTVTSRLLQMDVDFRVEYEESGLLYDSIVHRASGDPASNDVSPLSTSPAPVTETQPFCSELSNKLDVLMDILLNFVTEVFKSKNHNNIGMGGLYEDDFNIFLNSFIRYVLPTYNSKVVQFIIFKICSFNEKYTQAYLDSLMNIIKDERSDILGSSSSSTSPDSSSSTASRVSACSYVGSFLTRAGFIKDYGLVENYLIDLLTYAKDHSAALVERSKRQHEKSLAMARSSAGSHDYGSGYYRLTSSSGSFGSAVATATPNGPRNSFVYIDIESHQVFYAAVQAAMHIFSYCYPQLVERGLKNGFTKISWLNSIGFQAVLASPLCPLDNCNQGVVRTFRSVWNFVAGDSAALKTVYSLSTSKYPYISLMTPKASRSRSPLRSASTSSFALSLSKSSSPTGLLSSSSSSSSSGFGQHSAGKSEDFSVFGAVLLPYDAYLLHRSARHIAPICKVYDSNFFNFDAIAEMKKEKDKDKECELKMVMPQRSTAAKRVKMEGYDVKEENDENTFSIPAKKIKKEAIIDVEDEDEFGKNKIKIEIDDLEEEEEENKNKKKEKEKKKNRIEIDDDDEESDDDDNESDKSENSDDESDDDEEDEEGRKSLSTATSTGFNYPVSISPNFNFSFD